ncbi:MAG: hypothetical protein JW787_13950 [Sedimentisphaerales bacterium]|nr:hypothetical protein [Sedimentisphaerales bacterium]
MKKQIKYITLSLAAFLIFLCIATFCAGQSDEEQTYYNNPDIISNRQQREQADKAESGIEFYKDTKIIFAPVEKAQIILTAKDDYINSQTAFDRRIRLNKEEPVSEKEYLDFLSEQVLSWNESEKVRIEVIIKNLAYRIKKYDLNLPPEIMLIKTTGKEEGSAAYCRGNAVVLPLNLLNQQGQALDTLIVHELFHIYTKNNLDKREALYGVINFKKCGKAELPRRLLDIEITNPDVPTERYCIELQHEGGSIKVIPMLTLPDFDVKKGRAFFRYLRLRLVEVEKINDEYKYKRNDSGEPVVYDTKELPDYPKKVGENTGYLIHPEEILADNFAMMVMGRQPVKSKWVIDKMQSMLETKSQKGVGL